MSKTLIHLCLFVPQVGNGCMVIYPLARSFPLNIMEGVPKIQNLRVALWLQNNTSLRLGDYG